MFNVEKKEPLDEYIVSTFAMGTILSRAELLYALSTTTLSIHDTHMERMLHLRTNFLGSLHTQLRIQHTVIHSLDGRFQRLPHAYLGLSN